MQVSAPQSRFPSLIRFRAPTELRDAIDLAARRGHTTSSEWARQALLSALKAGGIGLDEDGRVENEPRGGASGQDRSAGPEGLARSERRQRPGKPPYARSEE
jgi:hypothetical protein